jgi:hypothetical protein
MSTLPWLLCIQFQSTKKKEKKVHLRKLNIKMQNQKNLKKGKEKSSP